MISCLTGSAKLVPYISGNRKAIKSYLRACLSLWSSPGITTNESDDDGEDDRQAEEDKVRLAAFLSIRRIAMSSDEGVLDLALKVREALSMFRCIRNSSIVQGSYTTLLRASKSTNPHSLPSITLMKNTAVDLYCIDQEASYQLAFGYIRQLAVTLRNALKGGKVSQSHSNSPEGSLKCFIATSQGQRCGGKQAKEGEESRSIQASVQLAICACCGLLEYASKSCLRKSRRK